MNENTTKTMAIDRLEGPYVVGGKLFFKMLDGSSISCQCIGEPYASQVVKIFETMIERAINDVSPDYV